LRCGGGAVAVQWRCGCGAGAVRLRLRCWCRALHALKAIALGLRALAVFNRCLTIVQPVFDHC
jgi:hypothetical protein